MNKKITTVLLIKCSLITLVIITGLTQLFSCTHNEHYNMQNQETDNLDSVKVMYVGNSGFMISIGEKKILVDGLFKGFQGYYQLPENIQKKLISGDPPFDNIDIVLATHGHGDHFDASMVKQYLENNPETEFVSTQLCVNEVDGFSNRKTILSPELGKTETIVINDISIEAYYLPHGPNSDVINIGFLITTGGVTFFHTGDVDLEMFSFEEFKSLGLYLKNIDLAFIQHFYLTDNPKERKFVQQGIGGDFIIPIHYHFTTPPFDASILKSNYPDCILFNNEMQVWTMPDNEEISSEYQNTYPDTTPPGIIPQIFASGFISDTSWAEHCQIAFSPDGDEVYWSAWSSEYPQIVGGGNTEQIYYSKRKDGKWMKPELAVFVKDHLTLINGGPVFSPDGNRLYFYSVDRPGGYGDMDTWYVERNKEGWGEPVNAGAIYNSTDSDWSPVFTSKGTAYKNFNETVRYKYDNGVFSNPEIIVIHEDFNPVFPIYISPDETYAILDSKKEGGYGGLDLYISFKDSKGNWGYPVNMGDKINTGEFERFPMVSPDGKYFFFVRHTETQDFFWVSTSIFEDYKNQ